MAEHPNKFQKKEKDERIDKQLDYSVEPSKRLINKFPPPDKADPRSHVQPSKQKHPRRAPGP